VREELVEQTALDTLAPLTLSDQERLYFRSRVEALCTGMEDQRVREQESLNLRLAQLGARLRRLTDVYLDQGIDQQLFEERKTALHMERRAIDEALNRVVNGENSLANQLSAFLELIESAWLRYKVGTPPEKRELLAIVTSNRVARGKTLVFMRQPPFDLVADRRRLPYGDPQRDEPRTWDDLLDKLLTWFTFARQSSDDRHCSMLAYLNKEDELAA